MEYSNLRKNPRQPSKSHARILIDIAIYYIVMLVDITIIIIYYLPCTYYV